MTVEVHRGSSEGLEGIRGQAGDGGLIGPVNLGPGFLQKLYPDLLRAP